MRVKGEEPTYTERQREAKALGSRGIIPLAGALGAEPLSRRRRSCRRPQKRQQGVWGKAPRSSCLGGAVV